MPIYDYKCTKCGNRQEEMRSMDDRNEPAKCEKCGGDANRTLAPISFSMKHYKRIFGKKVDPGDPRHKAPR